MKRKTQPPQVQGKSGFSLIEVLIAVTIIAIMGGVVAFNVFPEIFRSMRTRAEMDIAGAKQAVNMYFTSENKLPSESDWPRFLIEGSKNHPDPYLDTDQLKDGQFLDPWGQPYRYIRHSSRKFEIVSYGADEQAGGEGDDADISSDKSK